MSTAYWFDEAPFTTYGEFNPLPLFTGSDSGHTVKQLQASGRIRFATASSSVGIYSYFSTAAGRTYALLQLQGSTWVQVGSVTIPATGGGAFQVFNLATGLDTGSVHEYQIVCITPIQGASGNWFDGYLELDTGTLATVLHPNCPVIAMYGDSITGVTNAVQTTLGSPAITDTRQADMWQWCNRLNLNMVIAGTAGGKVVNTGRDSTANIPIGVGAVRVEYGINDAPDLPAGNATFQTAYGVMISNIRTRVGAGVPIVCEQPWPTVGGTQQSNLGTLIQAAIVGMADVYYAATSSWFTASTALLPDDTHPNIAGYATTVSPQQAIFGALFGGSVVVTTLNVGTLNIG